MNILFKILLAVLAAVVLISVAIAVAVAFIFEPNDYRPFVVDSVQKATGREFVLDGDLGLNLFPCCGVSVGSASLGNPPGFPETTFARIESASVSVKIWPLLTRREVQIGTVSLDLLDVNLIELPDGRTNWTFETGETEAEPQAGDDAPIASLTIEGLAVRNGNVRYTGPDGAVYSAREIRLDAGAIGDKAPVPVAVQLTALDEGADITAAIELAGLLGLDGDLLNLDEPRLTIRATGAGVPTGEASADIKAAALRYDTAAGNGAVQDLHTAVSLPGTRVEVTGNVELAGDAVTGRGGFRLPEGNLRQLLEALPDVGYQPDGPDALKRLTGSGNWALTGTGTSLSDLDLQLDDSRITGSAGLTSFDTGAVMASLQVDRLNVDGYLPSASPPPSNARAEPTEVPFDSLKDLLVSADLKIASLTIADIALEALDARFANDGRTLSVAVESALFGGRLKLNGNGNPAAATPTLAGQLEVSGISPRAALATMGETIDTANPEALTRLSGTNQWRLGRRSLTLEQMSWQLDATRLSGTLGIEDFDSPATRFDLALDRIDLDDYLAPEAEAIAADDADVEIPVELIRALNLNGRLKAAALRVMDLDLTNLEASISAADGVLRFEPLRADLYGGAYQGNIVIDATGDRSRLSLDQQVSAVQVGQVLKALVGSDRIAGALTFNLTGSATGNTQTELLKALTGNMAFNLSDGIYHGMDIAYEIENAQSLFKRTAAPERPNRKQTPIQALSFSGRMMDGMLGTDNLNAEIPFVKLGGKGGINLVERSLDYQLNAQVLKAADSAGESRLKGLGGSTIPLTIKGPMADPKIGVNMQGLVVEAVKERAREEILKRLGVGTEAPATSPAASGASQETTPAVEPGSVATTASTPVDSAGPSPETAPPAAEEPPAQPPTTRDLLERGLRGLLKRQEPQDPAEPADSESSP